MKEFWAIFQVVLLLRIHDHDLCTFSSHGPHKTASHLQFHIHASSILTRLTCGKPSEVVVPSFPYGRGADWLLTTGHFLVRDNDVVL